MGPERKFGRASFFDGGLLPLIGWTILGFLVTIFSVGILYPWSLVMVYGWKINHTVIDGHRMQFSGSAVGLFGNWIKWLFLMIITVGIYSFLVGIKLRIPVLLTNTLLLNKIKLTPVNFAYTLAYGG